MRISTIYSLTLVTALTACSGATGSLPGGSVASGSGASTVRSLHPTAAQLGLWPSAGPAVSVCGAVPAGSARCLAMIRTDIKGVLRPAIPAGYGPSDLQTAYNLTSYSANNGSGQTVAIVDAYDDPNAESDLAVYRSQYGLSACTTANGCFSKVKQGSTANTGWAEEESLDVDMASAICPNCQHHSSRGRVGDDQQPDHRREVYATAHANYVSNSWSGNEGSTPHTTATTTLRASRSRPQPATAGITGPRNGRRFCRLGHRCRRNELDSKISPRTESAWSGAGSGCSTRLRQAELPERRQHRLLEAGASRCVGRRQSQHRRRGLRFVWPVRVAGIRRHVGGDADHRPRSSRLRATPARTTRVTCTRTLRV